MLFGISAGLTLDEFALWVNLEDVYWAPKGRESIDAVIVADRAGRPGAARDRDLGDLGEEVEGVVVAAGIVGAVVRRSTCSRASW